MRRPWVVVIALSLLPFAARAQSRTISFDPDWRFFKGDATDGQKPDFDDSSWKSLSVPHDWSIEGPFDRQNPAGGAGAFLPTGVGWYRKHFSLPADDSQRRVFVDFDGVMANSDVWINGFLLGHRPYGYVSFRYELSDHLNFGDHSNVLAVRVDDSAQPASRWYAGAGIYRHVRLVVTDAVHLDLWGTFITTPQIEKDRAQVHVWNRVVNQSGEARQVQLRVTLLNPTGRAAAKSESETKTIAAGKSADFDQDLSVEPKLWDLDQPNLYRAVCEVVDGDTVLDEQLTPFGIRTAEFKSDSGFWLNGKNFKIKGVALHGDVGGLGVAAPLAAWEHRLTALKQIGVNAIRTAHNPPSPEFLDLCDRMGFLVMDEMFDCWTVAKNPYDYHLYFRKWSSIDAADTVRRDRNHPSVILYSAGNEIHDTPNPQIAIPILKSLIDVFHTNDPTRPVTQALFRPNVSHDYDDGLADLLDVVGTNYRDAELLAAHAAKPSRKIIGTENGPTLQAWAAVRDNPAYSGQFIWAGVDYLGESRRWPAPGNPSGLLDKTDQPRTVALQRQSWWTDQPMVRIAHDEGAVATGNLPGEPQRRVRWFCDWTPADSSPHRENVLVFSNCQSVELFLNGKSLGSQPRRADDSPRSWRVDYAPARSKRSPAIMVSSRPPTS